eukprot:191970_1
MLLSVCVILQIYLITSIVSQTCDEPYQCMDQQMSVSSELYFDINGYKAATGPSTSFVAQNGVKTSCVGAFSCHGMSSITTDSIICQGTHSCSNTSIQASQEGLYCSGLYSCAFSVLTSTVPIICNGEQSCANSRINTTSEIRASGSMSLYGTVIHSQNSDNDIDLTISLRADLAGYGATLICHEGHTCTVQCLTHRACYMFHMDCAHCFFTTPNNAIKPIRNVNQLQIDDTYVTAITGTEQICNTNPNAIVYDAKHEGAQSTITLQPNEPLCCRGRGSCLLSHITYTSITTESVICSGGYACQVSTIHANHSSVFCESDDSCSNAQIYDASFLYCGGYISCSGTLSIITGTQHIVCSAKRSCYLSAIHSGGVDLDVYFTGHEAGANATIHCGGTDQCNVECRGYNSCKDTTLFCSGSCNLYCDIRSKCPIGWSSSPTSSPTANPTTLPTTNTIAPSDNPTMGPAINPTIISIISPMIDPTIDPSTSTAQSIDETVDVTESNAEQIESNSHFVVILLVIMVAVGSVCIICILVIAIRLFYCKPQKESKEIVQVVQDIQTMSVNNDLKVKHNKAQNLALATQINVAMVMKGSAIKTATIHGEKAENVVADVQQIDDDSSDHDNDDLYWEHPTQTTQ